MQHPFAYPGPLPILTLAPVLDKIGPDTSTIIAPAVRDTPATTVQVVRVERKTGALTYMRCPRCGCNRGELFAVRGAWQCRGCAGLRYRSEVVSGRKRHRIALERLAQKYGEMEHLASDERATVEGRIAAHESALLPHPRRATWSAARRQRYAQSVDPHRQIYGNRSHLAGQKTPHSQVAYDALPSTAHDRKTAVARAIIEQNARRENAPSIFREVATRDDAPVVAETHEHREIPGEREQQEYLRLNPPVDAFAPAVVVPHRDTGAWLYDGPPARGEGLARWHEM